MRRLLILWRRPYHLTATQAEAWVRYEVGRLETPAGVKFVQVRALESAAVDHPARWQWMLELDARDAAAAAGALRRGPVADWMRDLRLLGTRPVALMTAELEHGRTA